MAGRPGGIFRDRWGVSLSSRGFMADPDRVAFSHFARPEHLPAILAPADGLLARRPVVNDARAPAFLDTRLAEGFLRPHPRWLAGSRYFGDLGLELVRAYIGGVLLRTAVPADLPAPYVAEFAHALECKHATRRGRPTLGLGYDCANGREALQAYLHSYVPLADYRGTYLAPVVRATRRGPGIVVPSRFIRVADVQPLAR